MKVVLSVSLMILSIVVNADENNAQTEDTINELSLFAESLISNEQTLLHTVVEYLSHKPGRVIEAYKYNEQKEILIRLSQEHEHLTKRLYELGIKKAVHDDNFGIGFIVAERDFGMEYLTFYFSPENSIPSEHFQECQAKALAKGLCFYKNIKGWDLFYHVE